MGLARLLNSSCPTVSVLEETSIGYYSYIHKQNSSFLRESSISSTQSIPHFLLPSVVCVLHRTSIRRILCVMQFLMFLHGDQHRTVLVSKRVFSVWVDMRKCSLQVGTLLYATTCYNPILSQSRVSYVHVHSLSKVSVLSMWNKQDSPVSSTPIPYIIRQYDRTDMQGSGVCKTDLQWSRVVCDVGLSHYDINLIIL